MCGLKCPVKIQNRVGLFNLSVKKGFAMSNLQFQICLKATDKKTTFFRAEGPTELSPIATARAQLNTMNISHERADYS
jgi:hypothetical protein